jgi:hypothetical protein
MKGLVGVEHVVHLERKIGNRSNNYVKHVATEIPYTIGYLSHKLLPLIAVNNDLA